MKILMLGWEFPPFNMGGLGTACYGLTKALVENHVGVTFVLPKAPYEVKSHVNLIIANREIQIRKIRVPSLLVPYTNSEGYVQQLLKVKDSGKDTSLYGRDLFQEVLRYKYLLRKLYLNGLLGDFDIIHAHDWMTYLAGVELRRLSKKPLVVQVHATEFDRNGGNAGNRMVHNIESFGVHNADLVIAVSNRTKKIIVEKYLVSPEKVVVVHNAVDFKDYNIDEEFEIKRTDKVVLFLGRITLQKGPDYFVEAANIVSKVIPHVKFVVVGSGDMEAQVLRRIAQLGLSSKFLFAGFLRGKDVDRAYKMADVYVMPSVSEPFGITPLEAMRNGTPVIISKQSGVSEVINNCLKVDFWDVNELANKIIAVLKYKALNNALKEHGRLEVKNFTWNRPAKKLISIYKKLLER